MPQLRLISINEIFSKAQTRQLQQELKELGVDEIPEMDDGDMDLDEPLNEEPFNDFMYRLEAHELACNVFLPLEFEGTVDIGKYCVGSAAALEEALEEIREELGIEEDLFPENDEEEEIDLDAVSDPVQYAYAVFLKSCHACLDRGLPLYVIS